MKYLFFIFPLLIGRLYAQTAKIWVLDSLTHEPIEGITMFSEHDFFYSDSNGFIQAKVAPNGLIWFKRMDYEQNWLNYKSDMDTVLMVRKAPFLNEVEVSAKPSENNLIETGYYHYRKKIKKTCIQRNLCIVAVYVPSYDESYFIDKILLSILSRKFAEDYTVYLYEPDSTGKPGKVLYKKNIVVDSLKKEGIINVHDLNIKVPNTGIFIGLENTKVYDHDKHNPLFGMGVRYEYTEKIDADLTFLLIIDPKINPKEIWTPKLDFREKQTPCFGLEVYRK